MTNYTLNRVTSFNLQMIMTSQVSSLMFSLSPPYPSLIIKHVQQYQQKFVIHIYLGKEQDLTKCILNKALLYLMVKFISSTFPCPICLLTVDITS